MDASEPASTPQEAVAPVPAAVPTSDVGVEKPRSSILRWMTIAVAAGLTAGVASWAAGEGTYGFFQAPSVRQTIGTIVLYSPTTQATNAAEAKNATVAFAIMGSILSGLMGLAGGFARRDIWRGLGAAGMGLILGGIIGGLVSVPLLALSSGQLVADPNDLVLPLLTHGGIWSAIGAVGGLAFGLGSGGGHRLLNAASGAFLGAVLASVLFEIIGLAVFPESRSTEPLAITWEVRLLARVLVCLFAAVGAAVGSWDRAHAPAGVGDSR